MLSAFTLSLAAVLITIFGTVYTENRNETSQNESDYDFADSGATFARNLTANFSVSNSGVENNAILNFGDDKLNCNVSITDRSENKDFELSTPKYDKAVEFNTPKNVSTEPKKLTGFRPSPQLQTFYEYNKLPVSPAFPEPKMVRNYGNINAEDNKEYFVKGEVLPAETERSRNLNNFEPGFSAFGNGDFSNSARSQDEVYGDTGGSKNNNGLPWATHQVVNEISRKNENGDGPWVNRVRFPQNPSNKENPYIYVPNTGADQNVFQTGQSPPMPISNYNINDQLSPPKNNEYLPPVEGTPNDNYNNINTNKVGYLPPSSNYGFPRTQAKNRYTSPGGPSGTNQEFNFNKFVEVPRTYYSSGTKYPPPYETSYNLMERPSTETQHKTYEGGLHYNPWKKILKLFATFIPIGLLISALTPTVITVTNVNDTTNNMPSTRYRSEDDNPKKELTNHILSSLDYFDKLNENGCEYRVFCELLVSASHMPNSKQHVDNLLDNFAKEEIDYKHRAEELKTVFAAVRSHDCNSIPCEFIKNPT